MDGGGGGGGDIEKDGQVNSQHFFSSPKQQSLQGNSGNELKADFASQTSFQFRQQLMARKSEVCSVWWKTTKY